jgi:hypothetical protein
METQRVSVCRDRGLKLRELYTLITRAGAIKKAVLSKKDKCQHREQGK